MDSTKVQLVFGVCICIFLMPFFAHSQGEIEDTQVIIEKDKPLTLPKANRLYKPTEISINQFQPAPVNYSFSQVDFTVTDYSPDPKAAAFQQTTGSSAMDNYVKLGYGNYQSPLVEGNYIYRLDEHYVSAFASHESFGRGPVRDEQSAFSNTGIDLKGHLHGDFHVDPYLSWSRTSYYFYGRDTAFDFANPLIIDDRIFLQDIQAGAEVRQGMETNLDYYFRPQYRSTSNKVVGGDRIGAETELSVDGRVFYHLTDAFALGLETTLATTKYESSFLQRRNFLSINPKLSYSFNNGSLTAGLEMATANDTTSESSSLFVFPDIDFNFNVSPDLSVYAKAGGGLHMVGLKSLWDENRFLEDDLRLLNQSNKVDLEGGIKSKLFEQLVLEGSLGYSAIENLPFFIHNSLDSSRFSVVYDSASIVRTTLGIRVGYFAAERLSINYSLKIFGYTMNNLEEPWYKPSSAMNVLVTSRPSDQLKISLDLMFMSGITAPSPSDLTEVDLPAIFDLGLSAHYRVTDNFSVFGQTRNLTNSDYERYLNYPVRGITFKLGLIYQFQ